jgi:hypothetical protein
MEQHLTLDEAADRLENSRGIAEGSVEVVYDNRGEIGEIAVSFTSSGGWDELGHTLAENVGPNVEFNRYTFTGRGYFRVRP